VPDSDIATAETLIEVDSAQLFVERASRARAASVSQTIKPRQSPASAGGSTAFLWPELAAAQIRVRTPSQLADKLEDRLPLVTMAARGVPDRQATMWASIDWSYQLLDTHERAELQSLAGLAGTFSAEAVESVAPGVAAAVRQTSGIATQRAAPLTCLSLPCGLAKAVLWWFTGTRSGEERLARPAADHPDGCGLARTAGSPGYYAWLLPTGGFEVRPPSLILSGGPLAVDPAHHRPDRVRTDTRRSYLERLTKGSESVVRITR
jgi:hypothetical protein